MSYTASGSLSAAMLSGRKSGAGMDSCDCSILARLLLEPFTFGVSRYTSTAVANRPSCSLLRSLAPDRPQVTISQPAAPSFCVGSALNPHRSCEAGLACPVTRAPREAKYIYGGVFWFREGTASPVGGVDASAGVDGDGQAAATEVATQ